jgi:hypothetical protein
MNVRNRERGVCPEGAPGGSRDVRVGHVLPRVVRATDPGNSLSSRNAALDALPPPDAHHFAVACFRIRFPNMNKERRFTRIGNEFYNLSSSRAFS